MQSTTAPKSSSKSGPLVPRQNEVAGASAKAKAKATVASALRKRPPQNGGEDSEWPVAAPAVPPLTGKASSKGTNESSNHAPAKRESSQWREDGDWYGDGYDSSGWGRNSWGKNGGGKNDDWGAKSGGGKNDDWGAKNSGGKNDDWTAGRWGAQKGGGKKNSYNKRGRDSSSEWNQQDHTTGSGGGDWHESSTSGKAASSGKWNGHTSSNTNANANASERAPTMMAGDSSTQPVAAPEVPPAGKATTSGKATPPTTSGKASSTSGGGAGPLSASTSGKATSLGKATSKSSSEAGGIPPKSAAVWQQPVVSKPKAVGPLTPQPLNPLGLSKPSAPLQTSSIKKVMPSAGVKVKHQVQLRHLPKGGKASGAQQPRKGGPGGPPGVPPAGLRAVDTIGKMAKMQPVAGRFAPLRQQQPQSNQNSVPKSGSPTVMGSKAPSKVQVYPRSCLCGNLTDSTYYVMFTTGQSYCSGCWEKLDKPMGFVQSLEQMKRLGALCLNT